MYWSSLNQNSPAVHVHGPRVAEEAQFLDVRHAVGDELEPGPVVECLVHGLQSVGRAPPIRRQRRRGAVVVQEVAPASRVLKRPPVEVVGDFELRAPVRGVEDRRERPGVDVPGILDIAGVDAVAERVRVVGAGPAAALFVHAVEREENAQPVAHVVEKL